MPLHESAGHTKPSRQLSGLRCMSCNRAKAPTTKSLPCVKGGGPSIDGGGIVILNGFAVKNRISTQPKKQPLCQCDTSLRSV